MTDSKVTLGEPLEDLEIPSFAREPLLEQYNKIPFWDRFLVRAAATVTGIALAAGILSSVFLGNAASKMNEASKNNVEIVKVAFDNTAKYSAQSAKLELALQQEQAKTAQLQAELQSSGSTISKYQEQLAKRRPVLTVDERKVLERMNELTVDVNRLAQSNASMRDQMRGKQ